MSSTFQVGPECDDTYTAIYEIQGDQAAIAPSPVPSLHGRRRRRRLRGPDHRRPPGLLHPGCRRRRRHRHVRRHLRLHRQHTRRRRRSRGRPRSRDRHSPASASTRPRINGANNDSAAAAVQTSARPAAPAPSIRPTSRCPLRASTRPRALRGHARHASRRRSSSPSTSTTSSSARSCSRCRSPARAGRSPPTAIEEPGAPRHYARARRATSCGRITLDDGSAPRTRHPCAIRTATRSRLSQHVPRRRHRRRTPSACWASTSACTGI